MGEKICGMDLSVFYVSVYFLNEHDRRMRVLIKLKLYLALRIAGAHLLWS